MEKTLEWVAFALARKVRYSYLHMNTEHFKEKLEEEKARLDHDLQELGVHNPDDEGAWTPRPSELEVDQADRNEVADKVEESNENIAVLSNLRVRYKNIHRALAKIENGTYGIDELDGEPIEEDRLEANPSARTRKANIERESELED